MAIINPVADYGCDLTVTTLERTGKKILYSTNQTASYVPKCFQNILKDGSCDIDELKQLPFTKDITELVKIANDLEEDIKNHVEVRIQIFSTQILLVQNQKFVIDKYSTYKQAGAKARIKTEKNDPEVINDPEEINDLEIINEKKTKKKKEKNKEIRSSNLAEAHASTLPSIFYVLETDLEKSYTSTEHRHLKPKLLGSDTSFDNMANLTHPLPEFVNYIDLAIDEQTKIKAYRNHTFRLECIEILNLASKGTVSYEQSLKNFLVRLLDYIELIQKNGLYLHELSTILFYESVIKDYLRGIENPLFLRKLTFQVKQDYNTKLITKDLSLIITNEVKIAEKIAQMKKKIDLTIMKQHNKVINGIIISSITSTNTRRDLILTKINKILSKKLTSQIFHGVATDYVLSASLDSSIRKKCLNLLTLDLTKKDPTDDLLKKLKSTSLHKELKKLTEDISKFIVSKNDKTRVQNIQTISYAVLSTSWIIERPTTEKERKIYQFLTYTPFDMFEDQSNHKMLSQHINEYLGDKEINTLCEEIYDLL